jgi:hypothetical protein
MHLPLPQLLLARLSFSAAIGLSAIYSLTVATANAAEVGHWSFNEGDGTTIGDSSGAGNSGTLVNSKAGTWTAGRVGSALYFDGTLGINGTRVEIPDSASLRLTNACSFAAWIRPDDILGDRPIFSKEGDGLLSYWFGLFGPSGAGHWGALFDPDGNQTWGFNGRDQGSLQLGTWAHLATTWDGTTVRYYLNGSLTNSVACTGTIHQSFARLFIGSNSEYTFKPNATAFRGAIDEVHIYNTAISDAEVAALSGQVPQVEISNAIRLQWQSVVGFSYQIQWSPTLQGPSWQNLGTAIVGDGSMMSYFDEASSQARKFYRVVLE